MVNQEFSEYIEINPKIMVGKPVIKGTRIPIELLVRMVAQGISEADILQEYPQLELSDIRAAISFTSSTIDTENKL